MNLYAPSRYDERIFRLAIGVEPRSAVARQRVPAGVDVRWELFPRPVDQWRRWRPGETLTAFLPRLARHHSGRFARRYDEGVAPQMDLRIVDALGRRFVPRRIRLGVMTEDVVAQHEGPTPPATPPLRRVFPVDLFPGAGADLPSGATVIRGAVQTTVDGSPSPVRWARVVVRSLGGEELGWAHGDDRGEFVLLVGTPTSNPAMAPDPLRVSLLVSAVSPSPAPDAGDPLREVVDPLWDLPIEAIDPLVTATGDAQLSGRVELPGHALAVPIEPAGSFDLPLGRATSVVVRIA